MNDYIEIKNLNIEISGNTKNLLVNNISFKLVKGETIGIVGESGSGKTLTAMAITGLLPENIAVSAGEINYNSNKKSINLLNLPEKELQNIRGKNISIIFQEPLSSLNPTMKCGGQVEEIIFQHNNFSRNKIKKRTLELFVEVDLHNPQKIYQSFPFQLSGGQQQRVMIAMAIANNPDYIIADEPTTALDVLVQKKIISVLKSLQQKYDIGIIFISHDIDLVADISHNILVMRRGEMVELNQTKKIISNPISAYTKGLLECKPRPDTPKTRLKGLDETGMNSKKISENLKNFVDYKKSPILDFQHVNIFYRLNKNILGKYTHEFHAVNDVSFSLYEGETLGIVGGSGSGKSTIGKSIVGLVNDPEGNILYKGNNIGENKKMIKKKIQLIFQDPYSSLNPKITVGDALYEVLQNYDKRKNRNQRKEKVLSLLNDVKLDDSYYYRYPHELSGGQRQRIVIARALAVEPEILICDESVSALDVSIQAEILNLLNELKHQRDLSLIFISHDLSVVKYMSHRILVLNKGKVEEIINDDLLFNTNVSDYTRQLINAMVILNAN